MVLIFTNTSGVHTWYVRAVVPGTVPGIIYWRIVFCEVCVWGGRSRAVYSDKAAGPDRVPKWPGVGTSPFN